MKSRLTGGEQIISAHGELAWMTQSIQMSQTTNTGGSKGLMQGLKRVVADIPRRDAGLRG